jgi:hypothetical protein
MAPPLAGSMNMRFLKFIRLDLVGATLYIVAYFSVGFVFSGALEAITKGYQAFGRVMGWAVIALIVGYVAWQCWRWIKEPRLRTVPFAIVSDAAHAMTAGAYVYDVRSPFFSYYPIWVLAREGIENFR